MVIDAHTHLFERYESMEGLPLKEFIRLMDEAGLQKAVVTTIEGFLTDSEKANDELARSIERFPERLIGFGTVNPWYGDEAVAEVRRVTQQLGFKGLKFHPWMQGFPANSDILHPLYEAAAQLRLPLQFHTGTPPDSQPLQVAEIAEHYPEVPVILVHSGLTDMWLDAVTAAKRISNLYLDTSGQLLPILERIIERVGAERMVFGSDMPWLDPKFELLKVESIDLSDDEREGILEKNISELLRI